MSRGGVATKPAGPAVGLDVNKLRASIQIRDLAPCVYPRTFAAESAHYRRAAYVARPRPPRPPADRQTGRPKTSSALSNRRLPGGGSGGRHVKYNLAGGGGGGRACDQ